MMLTLLLSFTAVEDGLKMMTFRTLSVPALFLLLTACSEASFTGNSPARATQPETPPADDGGDEGGDDGTGGPADPGTAEISCALNPGKVKIGGKAAVALSVKNSQAELYQTVISGTSRAEAKLIDSGTDGVYTLENGAANEIVGTAEGTLTVEIRKTQGQEVADATCTLNVAKDADIITTPECKDTERKVGAEIAFLIDNSNSNAVTDCPNDVYVGTQNGVDMYECRSETNRERAVLAAYDLLRQVAASESGNAMARSTIAVGSFPTAADPATGWKNESKGFLDVVANGRASLVKTLAFSRKPAGMTPYGAAMGGATEIFNGATNSKRAKLAVLVTDGEPTDQAPEGVAAKAAALKAKGVNVITVFVTSGEARESRESKHVAMLKKIDNTRLAQTGGKQHWYDSRYSNFDSYIAALLGGSNQASLVSRISGKVVEVQNSAALEDAFLKIIKTEAIKCEP